jgi:hypothetical protein
MARTGGVVRQAIEHLNAPLGPGDPREIAWVQAQQAAFRKWLEREWARGPDLDHIYTVAFADVNRISREKSRQRRSTPEGRAKAAEATRRSRAKKTEAS